MAPYSYLFSFTCSLFFTYFIHFITANKLYSSTPHLFHKEECSALLQFKHSLSLNKSASVYGSANPKTKFWRPEGESSNCCSWHGVECDNDTGHVIGLDLSSSLLYGPINSNSSLFSLVHLQRLNLADNDFIYSEIPPEISRLSSLSSLNLSLSSFSGQIPSELLRLSRLVSLDLSCRVNDHWSLKLENPQLRVLVQNLTNLKEICLHNVNISSEVPEILAHMTSITALGLSECGLYGEFPPAIFLLPDLHLLDVSSNEELSGYLPEFHQRSSLEVISLFDTGFYGNLPVSVGNLKSLKILDLSACKFSGSVPVSLANLTQLTSLALSLDDNEEKLSWIGKHTQLTNLFLIDVNLSGEIPSYFANLTKLTALSLRQNHFYGEIPSWMMNLTQLTMIDLSTNQLHGPISSSFSELKNLNILVLYDNHLSGIVDVGIFCNLKQLTSLMLSYNKITFLTQRYSNSTLPQFEDLELAFCNLREFPYFLRYQNQLKVLNLQHNKILGKIPQWIWNISSETLEEMSLSDNFLTGVEQYPVVFPGARLRVLDISNNRLQGNLPIPPPNVYIYLASNNSLTGDISPLICRVSSLFMLDLSNNVMSGTIPPCLANFSTSLSLLNLRGNNFSGTIPQAYTKECNLVSMELSQNQLAGQIPRSLENCTRLQFLNLGGNLLEDIFPFWLGALPRLQVLILQSNRVLESLLGSQCCAS